MKYTDAGGRIDDYAARRRTRHVDVRDTGIGIAAEHLPFVWDRLYRADASRTARGLGLGLSLVKAVVEAHGGTVEVIVGAGRGQFILFRLPAACPSRRD